MLQMALKMATGELDEPAVDLETALTPNTITATQATSQSDSTMSTDGKIFLHTNSNPSMQLFQARDDKKSTSFQYLLSHLCKLISILKYTTDKSHDNSTIEITRA